MNGGQQGPRSATGPGVGGEGLGLTGQERPTEEGMSEQGAGCKEGGGGKPAWRENSTCKGPGVRESLQSSKKAGVPAAQ